MEPKTRLDFLIEEFFNTGKLNLNKKDGGITFDQLESLNEYGGNHRSPFESSTYYKFHKDIIQAIKEGIEDFKSGDYNESEENLEWAYDQLVNRSQPGEERYFEKKFGYSSSDIHRLLQQIPLKKQGQELFDELKLDFSNVSTANYEILEDYTQQLQDFISTIYEKRIEDEFKEEIEIARGKIKNLESRIKGYKDFEEKGVSRTVTQQLEKDEEERKEEIDTSNVEDLPTLQQGQDINNPTNLTTLQFILLNNYVDKESVEDRKKLNNEIKDRIFGDITTKYVEIFQSDNGLKKTGIVDKSTWDKLMKKLTQEQYSYFKEASQKNEKIKLEELEKLVEYKEELNDKEELFVNSMSKFLMILLGQDPYPGVYDVYTYNRGLEYIPEEEFGEDLNNLIRDYTKVPYGDGDSEFRFIIEDLEELKIKKHQYNQSGYVGKEELSKTQELDNNNLKKEIKDLEEKIEKKNKKAQYFWDKYPYLFRTDKSGYTDEDIEKNKTDYFKWRQDKDLHTSKGFFTKIYDEFKKAIEDKSYSLDEISNIVFMINNTIYKLFDDTSMTDQTTLNKTKRAIKGILEMVVNAKDRDEMFEFVLNITDPSTVKAYEYELSFCECGDGEYFKCDSLGDRSTIIPKSRKKMIELITSNLPVNKCVGEIYYLIGKEKGENIDKYDIIAQKEIVLEGGHTIQPKTKIEVKRTDIDKSQYHFLSEFFGVYKSSYNIEHYSYEYAYNRYNEIVSGLVEKLNEDDFGITDNIEKDMGGLFLEKYIYYPKGHFKLEWGDTSRGTIPGEKRVVIRYKLTKEGYRWKEGNCNIPEQQMTNESMDKYISEVLGF